MLHVQFMQLGNTAVNRDDALGAASNSNNCLIGLSAVSLLLSCYADSS
jgi:hypothetical protein